MISNEDVQKLFTTLYGISVELKLPKQVLPPAIDHVKEYFVRSVSEWRNAYMVQDTLHIKYGIDLNGYDAKLYDALESMVFSFFGPVRGSIVIHFVYYPLNLEVEAFKIIDKNGRNYLIANAEELYYFIINAKDQDFYQEDQQ